MKNISHVLMKNSIRPFSLRVEELLREHNINTDDSKTIRIEPEKHLDSNSTTKKRNLKLRTQNLFLLNFI